MLRIPNTRVALFDGDVGPATAAALEGGRPVPPRSAGRREAPGLRTESLLDPPSEGPGAIGLELELDSTEARLARDVFANPAFFWPPPRPQRHNAHVIRPNTFYLGESPLEPTVGDEPAPGLPVVPDGGPE